MDMRALLKQLPKKPGVYRMLDSMGNIIYVGKAKNLKNRVSQYFINQKDREPKVAEMIRNIETFNYTVTDTELDAFIEECRLIKEIKPKYNRLMVNDKRYVYIKISDEPFPRLTKTNEIIKDGANYFGPFTSLHQVETALRFFTDFYPIRKCGTKGSGKKANKSGCLYYSLGSCLGACTGKVSQGEYSLQIARIEQVLNGKDRTVLKELIIKQDTAINELDFEKASLFREYHLALKHVISKQRLIISSQRKKNILALEFMDETFVKIFFIKGNLLLHREVLARQSQRADFEQYLEELIRKYFIPIPCVSKISDDLRIRSDEIDEAQIIHSYLKKNKKNIISVPVPSSKITGNMSLKDLIDHVYESIHI